MDEKKILPVEDEQRIADILRFGLQWQERSKAKVNAHALSVSKQ